MALPLQGAQEQKMPATLERARDSQRLLLLFPLLVLRLLLLLLLVRRGASVSPSHALAEFNDRAHDSPVRLDVPL